MSTALIPTSIDRDAVMGAGAVEAVRIQDLETENYLFYLGRLTAET
jgi:hypothetical protein